MSCLDNSDDHLRWLAPTDLSLDYMGIAHLDCVTLVSGVMVWDLRTRGTCGTCVQKCNPNLDIQLKVSR